MSPRVITETLYPYSPAADQQPRQADRVEPMRAPMLWSDFIFETLACGAILAVPCLLWWAL